MAKRIDAEPVRQAARGQWLDILSSLGGVSPDLLDTRKEGPCPKCDGETRFRVVEEAVGAVYCNQCFNTKNGDGFAAISWMLGCTFPESVQKVAEHLGIDTNAKKTGPAKDLKFQKWVTGLAAVYLGKKPGITEAALLAAGAKLANYKGLTVLAFPVIGQSLNSEKPTGWAVVNCISESVPTWDRDGNVTGQKKIKVLYGSKAGLFNVHATDRLSAEGLPEIVWKVEGLTDLLSLMSIIPEQLRDRIWLYRRPTVPKRIRSGRGLC